MVVGKSFNQYQITASIGAGGMGEVFRARDTRLSRDVAIKVLPKDFASDADRLRRFEQEAKTLAALNHPNVMTIHDAGVHEGAPYLVSELLEGRTLREEMNGGALAVRKATDYALQIAHGLAAAHGKGIIHRDLKPENIFVTKDGRVKILDFGLAKLRANPKSEIRNPKLTEGSTIRIDTDAIINTTEPGLVLGTPAYMSPEQVRGEPADHRSDIFAFGCVLYEMLSGTRAFRRDTPVESMSAVLNDTPPELSATNPTIPIALVRIVERCLEKQSERRFQSASDLAFALAEWSSQRLPPPKARALQSWTWKHAVTVFSTILLVALGVWRFVVREQTSRPSANGNATAPARMASIAVLPLENLSREPEQEFFSDGMTDVLITELQKIGAWRVISRTTMMRYKKTTNSLPEIARELNVDGIVEGAVRGDGQRILITAKLIDGLTERPIWADSFSRDARDMLSVQSEVALAIARAIEIKQTPEERARLSKVRQVNPEAVYTFFKGREQWMRFTVESIGDSIKYCKQTIQLDPNYAAPHAQLGACYNASANLELMWPAEAYAESQKYLTKSLELEETDMGRTHLAAIQLFYDWDWKAAEQSIKRALELNRNEGLHYSTYSIYLAIRRDFAEAIRQAQRGAELEPYSPVVTVQVGQTLIHARRFKEAITELQSRLNTSPDSIILRCTLADALVADGQHAQAVTVLEAAPARTPLVLGRLGHALARSERKQAAEEVLKELLGRRQEAERTRRFYVSPYNIALVYTGLGDNAQALDWLKKGFDERIVWMTNLKTDPLLDSLRQEPRFQELVKKLNFPP